MSTTKNKRIREQRKAMTLVLCAGGALSCSLSTIINDQDFKLIFLIVGIALLNGCLFASFFKGRLGYKPTLEEIEERQFGERK
jgi:hypothetical protein